MDNGWVWFFSISGFILGLYGAIIGTWDLFVDLHDRIIDLEDLHQDAGSLKLERDDEDAVEKGQE